MGKKIEIKNEKIKLIFFMIIIYGISFISSVYSYPLRYTSEEVGALSGAAYLAGLDWTGVMGNSGYYGVGWYSLFFWIFKITDSPFIIYSVILGFTEIMKPLTFLIAYYLAKNYFNLKSEIYLFIVAFLSTEMGAGGISCGNELPYQFCIWLTILLMCKSIQYNFKKKGLLYLFLLIFTCAYALTLHTRALTLLIAVVLIFIIFALIRKEIRALIPSVLLPILYFIIQYFIANYTNLLWGITSNNELANTTVNVNLNINIFDIKTWSVWAHMLLGMFGTENIITGGLFVAVIVGFFYFVYTCIKSREWQFDNYSICIISITFLCIGATILALLVSSWFTGMYSSWGTEVAGEIYSYKGLLYVRYWNVYLPPLVLCILSLLPKFNWKHIVNFSYLFVVITHASFIIFILPYVQDNRYAYEFLNGVLNYSFSSTVSAEGYLTSIIISLLISSIVVLAVNINLRELSLLPVAFFYVYILINNIEINIIRSDNTSMKIMASYEMKCEIESKSEDIVTFYLNDESDTDNNGKLFSIAQFYFNRYAMQMRMPDMIEENDIIISTSKSLDIETKYEGINCYILDNNEVWYTYLDLTEYFD